MKETMDKIRAGRNRTLSVTDIERTKFSKNLLRIDSAKPLLTDEIINKTIFGDLIAALDNLPEGFADLIVIDPPYNLDKDFNGFKFKSSDNNTYLEYLRSWFPKVLRRLKANGSLYLCGDWKCTSALQQVMEENMIVMNRITWQREKGRGALQIGKTEWRTYGSVLKIKMITTLMLNVSK